MTVTKEGSKLSYSRKRTGKGRTAEQEQRVVGGKRGEWH